VPHPFFLDAGRSLAQPLPLGEVGVGLMGGHATDGKAGVERCRRLALEEDISARAGTSRRGSEGSRRQRVTMMIDLILG